MVELSTITETYDELINRQDYLIVQANDLARSFGNLNAFEHKMLDYCFSYVKQDSQLTDIFRAKTSEILKHFGLNDGGRSYEQVSRAVKRLNEKTALCFRIEENGVKGLLMTHLFRRIKTLENGEVEFAFSEDVAPYVFALTEQYYSLKLTDTVHLKSKYALVLLKLWKANQYKNNKITVIRGDVFDFQTWFLGEKNNMDTTLFFNQCLQKGAKELEKKLGISVKVSRIKQGRKVTGFEITVMDTRAINFIGQ